MLAISLALLGMIALEAKAGFKMPKSVYRMDQIETAKATAEKKNQAITIIYTNEKSSCGLCAAASLNAAKKLGRKTVVVYADSTTEWGKLPEALQVALKSPEAGRYIPNTVIMDAEFARVLIIVPYARGKEYDRLLNDALKILSKLTIKPRSE